MIDSMKIGQDIYMLCIFPQSARRIGKAWRVRQLGVDETSKFQNSSMVTSVLVEPTEGAPLEVVVMRAAYSF